MLEMPTLKPTFEQVAACVIKGTEPSSDGLHRPSKRLDYVIGRLCGRSELSLRLRQWLLQHTASYLETLP